MNKEQEKIPDFLQELKNENPFKIPDGYFDKFSRSLTEQIQYENEFRARENKVQFRHLSKDWFIPVSIAATVLLCLASLWWIFDTQTTDSQYVMNINTDEARVYIMANLEEFDEWDFSTFIETSEDFLLESIEEIDLQELIEELHIQGDEYLPEDI